MGFELCITDTKECLLMNGSGSGSTAQSNFYNQLQWYYYQQCKDETRHWQSCTWKKKLSQCQCHFDFAYPVDHPLISHPPSTPVPLLTWWWWILIILWYSWDFVFDQFKQAKFSWCHKSWSKGAANLSATNKKYELHQKLVQFVFFKSHKTAQQQNASSFIACESNGPNTTTTTTTIV